MFKRILKDAINQIKRNSSGTIINLTGMVLGIAVFLLILLHVESEVFIHKNNPRKNDIFRIANNADPEGWKGTPAIIGEIIDLNLPEVESFLRLDHPRNPHTVVVNNQPKKLGKIAYADSTLFRFFPQNFLHGDPETCLNAPYSFVITESTALKVFGRVNMVGEMVMLDSEHNVLITGVIEDSDNKTHLDADGYLSFHTMPLIQKDPDLFDCYGCFNYDTYLMLAPNVDHDLVLGKINEFIEKYALDRSIESLYEKSYLLDGIQAVYFGKERSPAYRKGNLQQLKIFSAIGLITLLLVLINYINLANAQSSSQVQELTIRKTLGATKWQLMLTKLLESVSITLISAYFGFLLMLLFKPGFENILGVTSGAGKDELRTLFFMMPAGAIIWGLIVGIYPSVFISRLGTARSLQTVIRDSRGRSSLRKFLTVIQLMISLVLVICTSIVFLQMNFTRQTDLGFDSDQLLYMPVNKSIRGSKDAFRQSIAENSNIESVSYSYGSYRVNSERWGMEFRGSDIDLHMEFVDEYYIETMGLTILEGRNFTGTNDIGKIIINRAAKESYFQEETLGTYIDRGDSGMEIIGVVENFHFMSFHTEVEPLALMYSESRNSMVNIRFREGSSAEIIPFLKSTWENFTNEFPFDYTFVSDYYEHQYLKEVKLGKTFIFFALISIFIASLGIYGLITFLVIKRTMEVAIRKIVGAKPGQILILFFRELSFMVIFSSFPALLISGFLMTKWLSGFSYRIDFPWFIFPLAILLVWFITMLTALGWSLKASKLNPVRILNRL